MSKLGPNLWDDPNYVLGSIIPRNKGFDLGSAELPFRTLYVENAVPVGANLHLTGTLDVDGATTLNSTLSAGVTSLTSLTTSGNVLVNGTLGVPGSILAGAINTSGAILAATGLSTSLEGATLTIPATGGAGATAGLTVANETTDVVVNTTAAQIAMAVLFGYNGGGTPAGHPYVVDIDPGVSFTYKAFTGDTSTYNWIIIKSTT